MKEIMTEMVWLFGAVPQVPDTPLKRARLKPKLDHVIQLSCGGVIWTMKNEKSGSRKISSCRHG